MHLEGRRAFSPVGGLADERSEHQRDCRVMLQKDYISQSKVYFISVVFALLGATQW
jgi:hypothetical protein